MEGGEMVCVLIPLVLHSCSMDKDLELFVKAFSNHYHKCNKKRYKTNQILG